MKTLKLFSTILLLMTIACQNHVKKVDHEVYDEVIVSDPLHVPSPVSNENLQVTKEADILGYWVGDFQNAEENYELSSSKSIALDEGLYWNRDNKINLSINKIENGKVYGHSVVAGNYRPFEGTYSFENHIFKFSAKEPGDDQYDGKFDFSIGLNDSLLTGKWQAYKSIDIKHRKFQLHKRLFVYKKKQLLEHEKRYANWYNTRKVNYDDIDEEVREAFGDFYLEFESSTELIYSMNASDKLLKKEDVENLKRGDLYIIRNTIYARHGYSFKNRPLRVFFDAQNWYIPVHNNIKKDLTEIEKENIKLLMKYEKNAKEYYDTFGRG